MQNFIFISPNFPTNYWQFCRELKNNGLNVLGIGDQPYEELKPELKASLNEYYKVNSLENYDEVYRAVAFFTFKYGRIDWRSPTMNTGWSGMPPCAPISTSPAASRPLICPASSTRAR